MHKAKKGLFVSILALVVICFDCCSFSLECNPKVKKKYIYFDHCYNGMTIHHIKFPDSISPPKSSGYGRLNKSDYEIISTATIVVDDLTKPTKRSIRRIYFDRELPENNSWSCTDYTSKKRIVTDTLCKSFIPGEWYFFNFYSPKVDIIVFVEEDGSFTNFYQRYHTNF